MSQSREGETRVKTASEMLSRCLSCALPVHNQFITRAFQIPGGRRQRVQIGILGGTFDPVHLGHLRLAEEAADAFALDTVLLVPNDQPVWDKGRAVTLAAHRLAIILLAAEGNPRLSVSRVELERSGPSYAIDTVRAVRAAFPALASLCWIVGADAVPNLTRWHEAPALLNECAFLAMTRPGSALPDLNADPLLHGRVTLLPAPGLDVSSSDLRRRVREGRSIRYLTPPSVEDYIRAHGLYAHA